MILRPFFGIIFILTLLFNISMLTAQDDESKQGDASWYYEDNTGIVPRIGTIYINQHEVFDSTMGDWFFAAGLANSLHYLTRQYIINDELLFAEGDDFDDMLLYETERNLRDTELFTFVSVEYDSLNEFVYDVYITTQDRWSTSGNILFGTGGNSTNYGGRVIERNLIGTGTHLSFEALHRSENDIGWQGTAELKQRRLFRTEFSLNGRLMSNRERTEQTLEFYKPFRSLETKYSFGAKFNNFFGNNYQYLNNETREIYTREKNLQTWFARSWLRDQTRIFITGFLEMDDTRRKGYAFTNNIDSTVDRAYDNTGKLILSFSSVYEEYIPTTKLNGYQDEDLPIGGYGAAMFGKCFRMNNLGWNLYYVAGQGERSFYTKDLYMFGQLTGASGFMSSLSYFTYQEFMGKAFYNISEDWLMALRVRQQTTWNWFAMRQLVLDNDAGLRGYEVNKITGDNRFIANTELRCFPGWQWWIFKMSATGFFDIGTAWDQYENLVDTRWHSSVGLGLRFHNMKSTGETSIFRIDFAYNFDEKKVGIIFTTDQLFSVFERHKFKLPQMFGTDFDNE